MITDRLKWKRELKTMERNQLVQLRYEILKLKVFVSTGSTDKRKNARVKKCDELIAVIENLIDIKEGRADELE